MHGVQFFFAIRHYCILYRHIVSAISFMTLHISALELMHWEHEHFSIIALDCILLSIPTLRVFFQEVYIPLYFFGNITSEIDIFDIPAYRIHLNKFAIFPFGNVAFDIIGLDKLAFDIMVFTKLLLSTLFIWALQHSTLSFSALLLS